MKKLAMLLMVCLAACDTQGGTAPLDPTDPTNLGFQLTPSGDPNVPLGIVLIWDPPANGRAVVFDVYGRSAGTGWVRRATTTSVTFHDAGIPQSQYYVVAFDGEGREMGRSTTITVDLSVRLPAPLGLTSLTLDHAIHLTWDDNAVHSSVAAFDHYRVYSSIYSSAKGVCEAPWYFEGSTVADGFLVGNLVNGQSRCFAVSAISADGHESTWSNARVDTPRSDAKTIVVYVAGTKPDSSAFLFNDETPKILGVIAANTRVDADFRVTRDSDGEVWITPARIGATMRLFQDASIADLSEIDRAPLTGYASTGIAVLPGDGYVFRLEESDGVHYGAIRVQYATSQYVVFDWAYQNGVGNPELAKRRR